MSDLYNLVKSRLDNDMLGAIAGRIGLGRSETERSISTALPALLGGMAHQANTPEGAAGLLDQVDGSAGGGVLDGLLERFRGKESDTDRQDQERFSGVVGGGMLDALVARLGIGGPAVRKLLGMLGPLVIGALGKLGGGSRLSPANLLSMLTAGAGAAADDAPGGRAGLAGLLGPIAGMLGLGGGAAAAVDGVRGSAGNVVDTVAERERELGTAAVAAPAARAVDDEPRRRRGALGWLIGAVAIAALIAALFGAKGCNDDDGDGAAPTPTTSTTSTTPSGGVGGYTVSEDDGKIVLTGLVPNEDARTAAVDAAVKVWGDGNVTDELTVDEQSSTGPAMDVVDRVMSALKGSGAGWSAEFTDADTVTLTGEVASTAVKSAVVKAATDAFAPGSVVDRLTVAAGGTDEEAEEAIDEINKEIRLRGVTFVTGSANLTDSSRTTLNRVAALLKQAPAVRAEVQGHTDNQGDAGANLALSTARARAVVAYLVDRGITANRLVAKGYGQTKPVATNGTDAGRAKNRRVVFEVLG